MFSALTQIHYSDSPTLPRTLRLFQQVVLYSLFRCSTKWYLENLQSVQFFFSTPARNFYVRFEKKTVLHVRGLEAPSGSLFHIPSFLAKAQITRLAIQNLNQSGPSQNFLVLPFFWGFLQNVNTMLYVSLPLHYLHHTALYLPLHRHHCPPPMTTTSLSATALHQQLSKREVSRL